MRPAERFAVIAFRGGSRGPARRVEARWSRDEDSLECLSVRTGRDLLLTALDLPKGSEVLFSAVTIPDMPQVAAEHDLAPVPVDVSGADLHIDIDSLRRAISPRFRVLVAAHLFGARPPMTQVLSVARDAGLFVVEDCAQAWCGPEYRGDPPPETRPDLVCPSAQSLLDRIVFLPCSPELPKRALQRIVEVLRISSSRDAR